MIVTVRLRGNFTGSDPQDKPTKSACDVSFHARVLPRIYSLIEYELELRVAVKLEGCYRSMLRQRLRSTSR